MKRIIFVLTAVLLCSRAGAQEQLCLSTAVPVVDTVRIVYSDGPAFARRDLALLTDPVDTWRDEVERDLLQSAEWQRRYGRQHTWRIGVDATTFLRDAAFALPYTRGYTATGFFLTPYAKHLIGQDAQLTLGVHLAGAAGYDGLHSWQPMVRLEYEPADNVRLVMGSLYGTLSHDLFEPMLDRERYIYDHQEEGVQLLAHWADFRTDTWLHWEELLEPWQMTQERFALGSNNELSLYVKGWDTRRAISVSVPFSFLGTHRGGQFSALDTCIQSLFNENVGLRVNASFDRGHALMLDVPFFFFQDVSPTKCLPYDKGWGFWPQLTYNADLTALRTSRRADGDVAQPARHRGNWQLLAQAGYWYGHQYIAPRGSYLFQSVSWHKASFLAPERQMLTAKLAFENRYNQHLALGLDAECYYDLAERGLDFAFGLYLRCRL